MAYLARREHSRAELRAKLLRHASEDDNVDAVLDELEQRDWLSDVRATEQLVNIKRARFGAQRIVQELRNKGIDDRLIDDALPELRESELDAAREVWRRKFGDVPRDAREKARQVRFMQSRGFSMDTIFKVLKIADLES